MRIFYLEEKLAKVEDEHNVHAPSQDAQAVMQIHETENKRLKEEVARLDQGNQDLTKKLEKTEEELLCLGDRLEQSATGDGDLKMKLSSALEANARLSGDISELRQTLERKAVEAEINGQTADLLNSYRQHNEKLTTENGELTKDVRTSALL